jgi:hypothetical protein
MRFLRQHATLIVIALACAAAGAGVSAIASAGAASAPAAKPRSGHALRGRRVGARLLARRLLLQAVHGDVVVATRKGFRTVTFDRGSIQSVSGRQLTLVDGTKRATYKTVTLTIPTTARVRDNGRASALGHLKPGQRAIVVQAPARTLVIAHTPR